MTTATVTSTAIELEGRPSQPTDVAQAIVIHPSAGIDDVVEASGVVDAGVPEGGYGWVAVPACTFICFGYVGTTYCWGVVQGALVAEGLSSASTFSWIDSMAATTRIALLAIVSARVMQRIGSRSTAISGIGFVAGSEILGGLSVQNVAGLFVSVKFEKALRNAP